MTNQEAAKMQEAIKVGLKETGKDHPYRDELIQPMKESCDMAIEALEKQTPKKTKRIITCKEIDGNFQEVCPSCGWVMFERVTTENESQPIVYRILKFCQSCGQRIDWGEL